MALLAACAGKETTSDTGPAGETGTMTDTTDLPATLVLSFDLDGDLIPQMDEPAMGRFEGSIYAEADASAIGPVDGAVPLADFESDELDFGTDGGLLADKATVDGIAPQIVWILGCLDTTGDGCDKGDPITVPNENKVQLTAGEGAYTVKMSLLNPS
ncbi:MAG: hypothetical protein R3F59_00325 [Myxococcota bacterium]